MNRWYYLKKSFAIFPGFRRPLSAPFLHDHYRVRAARRSMLRLLLDGVVAVGFRAWVPWRARSVAQRFGLDRKWATRASGIARRRFWDPQDIAVFRVSDDADTDNYLRRFEYAALSKAINPVAWAPDCALADKARFAEHCAAHDLPVPLPIARVRGGAASVDGVPIASRIAAKPTRGLGGRGFALLDVPAGLDAAGFARWLEGVPALRRSDWIVQAHVAGHPELADLALDALSTARLTTMLDELGEPEIVTAVLRFAGKAGVVVDNLAAGGLLASIDVATGTLDAACWGRKPGDVDVHPATGAAIARRALPNWAATRDLVLRAHSRAFRDYVMVGWDVGIGADGPVLIEGNGKPGLFAAQRATRGGVATARFGTLLAYHLRIERQRRGLH